MILTVPQDTNYWPSLGPGICDFIEQNLVFGPGDLRGQPAILDDEKRALIFRIYEVYPKGHAQAGRRRFKRVGISLRKGTAKTEFAAWIAACELHAEGPVRCTGFTKGGEPIGGPVMDPYIPLVAYTEEQSEDLVYGALRVILELSTLKDDFVIGLERIERTKGGGRAQALAGAPDARDGARTTFQSFDESHRLTLPRQIRGHQTMLGNIPKRFLADAWTLETTTAFEPGGGSVAQATMEYAQQVESGAIKDARLFFFHRQASDHHDLNTDEGVRAAVLEASGPSADWSDIESIVEQFRDPTIDHSYQERVWLNRPLQSSSQAFDVVQWSGLARSRVVPPGTLITLGFDGALFHDSSVLVATDVVAGYQWPLGIWERPQDWRPERPWKVPTEDVDRAVHGAFAQYQVCRFYCDPPYWETWVAAWAGEFGADRVHEWWTNRRRQMAAAIQSFATSVQDGTISHAGDKVIERHIGNARKEDLPGWRDEQGRALYLIRKERPDSPQKMDGAMACVLSWEARNDAIAAGQSKTPEFQMLFLGGRR